MPDDDDPKPESDDATLRHRLELIRKIIAIINHTHRIRLLLQTQARVISQRANLPRWLGDGFLKILRKNKAAALLGNTRL